MNTASRTRKVRLDRSHTHWPNHHHNRTRLFPSCHNPLTHTQTPYRRQRPSGLH